MSSYCLQTSWNRGTIQWASFRTLYHSTSVQSMAYPLTEPPCRAFMSNCRKC